MRRILQYCKPYFFLMRLDKPIGSLLLLWPTLWAVWIAANGQPPLGILLIFLAGVFVMRSAGCVINDIADRKFDGAVKRTQNRPLVLGSVTLTGALMLFISLCTLGLILVWQLNFFALELSLVAVLLTVIYPFTKRITYFPQVVLGAAFAWSVPMAFAAIQGNISVTGWLLYVVAVIWPVSYDSIYALMDREEDQKIGVKSTAILFGKHDITLILCLQLSVLAGLLLIGRLMNFIWFYDAALFIALLMVAYQIALIKKRTVADYYRAFYNNHWLGLIILVGIIFNYLF